MTQRHEAREALHDDLRRALLHELRRAHRSERAPAMLRQRLLERLEHAPSARSSSAPRSPTARTAWGASSLGELLGSRWATVALPALAFGALLLVLRPSDPEGVALGPEPFAELRGERRSAGPSEPRLASEPGVPGETVSSETRGAREPRPCPRQAVPAGAAIEPAETNERDRRAFGLELHTFDMVTPSCGAITRRYLQRSPPGLPARARVPVMLVLHDTGQSAESMRIQETRWHLDEVAERAGFILVYANAAPGSATRVAVANSGGWAADEHTHPEIEDDVYLQRITSELITRQVIDGTNDVFLLGYGGGAMMALEVAARQPGSYAGVAAFMPTRPEAITAPRAPRRLSRVLFVLSESQRPGPSERRDLVPAFARRWGEGLGISQPPLQRHWQLGTSIAPAARVRQLDLAAPASGAAAVRVLVLDESVDPFPVAPVGARRRGPARAPAFDGAGQAWAFLSGVDGAEPPAPAPSPPAASFAEDDDAAFFADWEGPDAPVVVLEEDVVEASPRRKPR